MVTIKAQRAIPPEVTRNLAPDEQILFTDHSFSASFSDKYLYITCFWGFAVFLVVIFVINFVIDPEGGRLVLFQVGDLPLYFFDITTWAIVVAIIVSIISIWKIKEEKVGTTFDLCVTNVKVNLFKHGFDLNSDRIASFPLESIYAVVTRDIKKPGSKSDSGTIEFLSAQVTIRPKSQDPEFANLSDFPEPPNKPGTIACYENVQEINQKLCAIESILWQFGKRHQEAQVQYPLEMKLEKQAQAQVSKIIKRSMKIATMGLIMGIIGIVGAIFGLYWYLYGEVGTFIGMWFVMGVGFFLLCNSGSNAISLKKVSGTPSDLTLILEYDRILLLGVDRSTEFEFNPNFSIDCQNAELWYGVNPRDHLHFGAIILHSHHSKPHQVIFGPILEYLPMLERIYYHLLSWKANHNYLFLENELPSMNELMKMH